MKFTNYQCLNCGTYFKVPLTAIPTIPICPDCSSTNAKSLHIGYDT